MSAFLALTLLSSACNDSDKQNEMPDLPLVDVSGFQTELNGKSVYLYTLRNKNGVACQITNFGGRVISLFIPDRKGNFRDVVLGHATLKEYLENIESYFGATIGRYGNRIGGASFELEGKTYELAKNDGKNHLHGGVNGFNNMVWEAALENPQRLELHHVSPDGDENYPGEVDIHLSYELTDENELKIEYLATTDKPTHINLTHHSYFNLMGEGNGDILDHQLQLFANQITETGEGLIPTGELMDVSDTPFDFRQPEKIGLRIDDDHPQIKTGGGYDHNYVLNPSENGLAKAAVLYEPKSGRTMEVYTNEPGIQFYAGNFPDGRVSGKSGKPYTKRSAFCIETQHFPDSPNQPSFPSTVLRPGEVYRSVCVYKFSVEE